MRKIIIEKLNEALEQTNVDLQYTDIDDAQVLLESGLDSLGFAILVALLEEELDFDPFQEMEDAVYPITFGEFLNIYENRTE
ncbi:acyl carrier protein [Vibrio sp. 3-2(1)]|uniref:acyl carrier protein n=1 Tax=Vibrio sp. 3-2(1) TaxID=2591016 RepID=UPI0014838D38|nr:acyl carrier protein [Vibrio sp. 3-2(1)]NNN70333.1 acyl carrier protein [Vibrio sp. 3-2(1)]